MKKQLALLVLGLGLVLLAAGQLAHAAAGRGANDIQDALPAWTWDGSRVYEQRTSPSLQNVVTERPSGKDLYVATFAGSLRGTVPNSPYILVQANDSTTMTLGGRFAGPRAIFHGTDAGASPDGTRVAYLRGGTLYVARIDNLAPEFPIPTPPERAIATGIAPPPDDVRGPVWSPDGTRIAIASGLSLLAVNADGSGSRVISSSDQYPNVNPSWSTDGTLAWESKTREFWQIWEWRDCSRCGAGVEIDGSANFRFPTFSPTDGRLAYITDRQHAKGGATRYQYALYVRGAADAKLLDDVHPYSPPAWSPTGDALAVSAGQECQRWGIYVVTTGATSRHRISNLCRHDGTPSADTIHGTPYFDIMNGLGGDDHLYGFWGDDKILGENGNDTIVGDAGNDVLFGGPGNDVISGGNGNDTIIGGPGTDRIDCGAGIDTVEGVDRLDRVSRSCEHVQH